jgi:hypothetical protein
MTVTNSKLVGLLLDSWDDLDRVVAGLDPEAAVDSADGGSSFAWTVAHLASQLDFAINVRFQKRDPHPLISQSRFRAGGTGAADDWPAIQAAARELREAARAYLENMGDDDLDVVIPYDGSVPRLRKAGLSLRYSLIRTCAHHYFHIGEIASKRNRQGHEVGEYPGLLEQCI